ncbi:MAG TPA: response regulator, partial [Sphingomicrobium sp.]|nr:response regulator [Sphingomicrobium sp.]
WSASHPVLRDMDMAIEISVSDTGIGIAPEKQRLIFEAFQQADGTTSRKYGGTGLGLSISREIARLLGGELQVRSEPGKGSTFTLFIPLDSAPALAASSATQLDPNDEAGVPAISYAPADDRADLGGEPFVLIVEDDPTFATILLELAHDSGLKGVISSAGSGTVAMVRKMRPTAITLDLGLSDIDGFVLLDLLRHDPETADIPVHVISGAEQAAHALTIGAAGVVEKPASNERLAELFGQIRNTPPAKPRRRKGRAAAAGRGPVPELAGSRILIIDDDIRNIYSLTSVLEAHDVKVLHAERGAEGISILETAADVDIALVDIMMPEMDGYETMRRIRSKPAIAAIPLIAVTAKAMKGDRQKCLDAGASDYIAKPVDIDLLLALMRVWIGRVRAERLSSPRRGSSKAA